MHRLNDIPPYSPPMDHIAVLPLSTCPVYHAIVIPSHVLNIITIMSTLKTMSLYLNIISPHRAANSTLPPRRVFYCPFVLSGLPAMGRKPLCGPDGARIPIAAPPFLARTPDGIQEKYSRSIPLIKNGIHSFPGFLSRPACLFYPPPFLPPCFHAVRGAVMLPSGTVKALALQGFFCIIAPQE